MIRGANLAALIVSAIALVGCQRSNGGDSDPNGQRSEKPPPFILTGQWEVGEIDGKPVPQSEPRIHITANNRNLLIESQCVWWFGRYSTGQKRFKFEHTLRSTTWENGQITPVPMCARGLSAIENNLAKALPTLQTLNANGPDRVKLAGPNASLSLIRASGPTGKWAVQRINGKPLGQAYPITLSISPKEASAASQCVSWEWAHAEREKRIRFERTGLDQPICERSRTVDEQIFETLMAKDLRWSIGKDATLTLRTTAGTLLLAPNPN